MKRTVRILRKARELIKEYGWRQGDIGDKETGFCAMGALLEAGVSNTSTCPVMACVRAVKHDIVRYNDARGRKRGEVLAVLRKAERLAAKGA